MSGHTPGPWTSELRGDSYVISAPGSRVIGMTGAYFGAEDKANADLVAAAPHMLAALRIAIEYLPTRDAVYARVREALAKAEGK